MSIWASVAVFTGSLRRRRVASPAGLVEPPQTLYTWRLFNLSLPVTGTPWLSKSHGIKADFQRVKASGTMALFLEFLSQQWILAAALLAVVVMLFLHEMRKSGPSLSPQQAINMVNAEEGVFLDLRDAADYKQGHIVDALHIPSAKLAERMPELEKYKSKPIVLVCKMGQQAGAAGKQLKANDFEKVYKMTGGMMEWGNLQLPKVS